MTISNLLSNNDWFYGDIWYSDYQIDKMRSADVV